MSKILLFTDSLGAGGAQRQLVGLACLLTNKGFEVKVCTYFNLDFYKEQLDSANIQNEIIPEAYNSIKRIVAVSKYFKKEASDWVIAYQETPSLVACVAKLLGGKFQLVVSERNTTQKISLSDRFRFFLYRWVDKIVPNSYSQEDFLAQHYPWMKDKIRTITNFVDLEQFNFIERTKRDIPEIVVVASIWPPKNTKGLILAVNILKSKNMKFHISWYGKPNEQSEYLEECDALIRRYNVENYIELREKTKNIVEVYHNADYFCLPSFYEGTPNVICEAISTGLPIICSDVCDNDRYVKEGINGFLFNPKDIANIAGVFESALQISSDDYVTCCKASRKIAENLLTEEVFINKYLRIIESNN